MLDIDPEKVRKLARLGCSNVEIADVLGCSESTVRGRFCEITTKGRSELKVRLRRVALQMALSGKSPVAMIWATKNILGWSDRPEVETPKAAPATLQIVRPDPAKLGS